MMRRNAIGGGRRAVIGWIVTTVSVMCIATAATAHDGPAPSALDPEPDQPNEKEHDDTDADRPSHDHDHASDDVASYRSGPLTFRLTDLSVELLFAVGGSTERDAALESLQGGGHDPRRRGFTLQNLELSLLGAVDPYFTAEAHLIYFIAPDGESVFELEEAFFTTQRLPFGLEEHGLELEGGQMSTEFGRLNPRHPHEWDWLDQPVIHSRVFGPDGMRGPGVRLGWLAPLAWFSQVHVGVQDARGETMASFLANDEFFEERPIAGLAFAERDVRGLGDLIWLARWENGWDFTDEVSAIVGVSGLAGPNASGAGGQTHVYGADFFFRWEPVETDGGWPFVSWQTEVLRRDYDVDGRAAVLPGEDLGDWGLYTQFVWGFIEDWAAGLRYEFASGDGPSAGGRGADPFRDDRHRLSPLAIWMPTHFSRVRLQYNFDHAAHLDDDAHSVWLGFEVLLGKHAAHSR